MSTCKYILTRGPRKGEECGRGCRKTKQNCSQKGHDRIPTIETISHSTKDSNFFTDESENAESSENVSEHKSEHKSSSSSEEESSSEESISSSSDSVEQINLSKVKNIDKIKLMDFIDESTTEEDEEDENSESSKKKKNKKSKKKNKKNKENDIMSILRLGCYSVIGMAETYVSNVSDIKIEGTSTEIQKIEEANNALDEILLDLIPDDIDIDELDDPYLKFGCIYAFTAYQTHRINMLKLEYKEKIYNVQDKINNCHNIYNEEVDEVVNGNNLSEHLIPQMVHKEENNNSEITQEIVNNWFSEEEENNNDNNNDENKNEHEQKSITEEELKKMFNI